MTMPLYAYTDNRETWLFWDMILFPALPGFPNTTAAFTLQRSNKLSINTDLEYLIQRHLNKTGQDFPFYIGEYSNSIGNRLLCICFYNYTLRTVFLDGSSLDATGDIYSFQIEEGISSPIQKSGSLFGLTSYYEGNNYILPEVEINVIGQSEY